jgi:hypothetical protein
MSDYKKAYRYVRMMEREGHFSYSGESPLEKLSPTALANALRSRALRHQMDRHERRFVMRCAYAKPELRNGKIRWIYDAESDGIPF